MKQTTDTEPTELEPTTVHAYEDSDFCIDADTPFVMHVDEHCAALAALYASHQAGSCAYISACNPCGETADPSRNGARQEAFVRLLDERGLAWVPGNARDGRGRYPPEPGCLVLGIGRDEAIALGHELQQNAILTAGADLIPRLELLR